MPEGHPARNAGPSARPLPPAAPRPSPHSEDRRPMDDAPEKAQRAPAPHPDRSGVRRAFLASLTGTALEWYDFAVYSAAAALVFGDLFFPTGDDYTGTLLAFSTYAVGYVSRPLGGLIFGRLGDVIGRKKVLIATLVLIGVSTFV